MSRFTKTLGIIAAVLIIGVGAAEARDGPHGHGGGGWHGGGWHGGWRGGMPLYGAWGPSWWGPGYYYDYYGPGGCDWVPVRVLRNGRWVVQQVWRCW